MDDAKFLEYIYRQVHDYGVFESEMNELIDDLTREQYMIVAAIAGIQAIGDNGDLISGMKRMEKSFPPNFRLGSGIVGVASAGSEPKHDAFTRQAIICEIDEMISRGVSLNDACSRSDISAQTYRRHKKATGA